MPTARAKKSPQKKAPRPHADTNVLGAMVRSGDESVAAYLVQTLINNGGSMVKTAKEIGVTARGLYNWFRAPHAHKSLAVGFRLHAQGRGSRPIKLQAKAVASIFQMRAEGKTMELIAKHHDVDTSTVSLILSGKRQAKASAKQVTAAP